MRRASEAFRAGRYSEASQVFQKTYESAARWRLDDQAARSLGNLGGCRFALHQYREALDAFLAARRLAEAAGDASAAGAMDANISSVYEQMGEWDAAAEHARRGAARLGGADRVKHLPKVLIHLGSLRARQGRMEEAAALFARGIDAADRAGDVDTWALGWDRLGEELFKRGDLAQAERTMLEAYRVRKLQHLAALGTSYRNLGRLRLAQGDLRGAAALLDRAAAEAPRGRMPVWDVYHARGLVRMAEGHHAEALQDLRLAVRQARAWRAAVSPADLARMASEQLVEPLYAALARVAAAEYFRTGRRELVREGFEAVEENRALSLRALVAQRRTNPLPPEYWETLARVQPAEMELVLRPGDREKAAELERLRAALAEIENRYAPAGAVVPETGLAARLARALGDGAAYFSFQLGEPESYVWAVDRDGITVRPLPGRAALGAAVREFAAAVRDGRPDAEAHGARLYTALFGDVARRLTARWRWFLALDDELFGLPVAVLRSGGAYVVERHAVQLASAAGLVAQAGGGHWRARLAGAFLGVGDPVYNAADERAPRTPRTPVLRAFAGSEGMELPRLAGSGREIEACAGEWNRPGAILLEGPRAVKSELRAALGARPAVVHLAVHVLESAGRSHYGLIALSLRAGSGMDILDPLEVAAWEARPGLVVLSGCNSGAGRAMPGSGLPGLTRAWLASGAGAVAATLWATPDGTGALFRSMYRRLREQPEDGPAAALARAQTEMLREGGWRARPRYWGAYFVVANQ